MIYKKKYNKYWNPFRLITNEEYELNLHAIIWFWILTRGARETKKMK
jgi:hypothetical protein